MSMSRESTVWCDVEGCDTWLQLSGNIRQVRKEARRHGWTRRDDEDLCPGHSKETTDD